MTYHLHLYIGAAVMCAPWQESFYLPALVWSPPPSADLPFLPTVSVDIYSYPGGSQGEPSRNNCALWDSGSAESHELFLNVCVLRPPEEV